MSTRSVSVMKMVRFYYFWRAEPAAHSSFTYIPQLVYSSAPSNEGCFPFMSSQTDAGDDTPTDFEQPVDTAKKDDSVDKPGTHSTEETGGSSATLNSCCMLHFFAVFSFLALL